VKAAADWRAEWEAVGASVIGLDHVRRDQPLQDASAAVAGRGRRPAAVVCDGAGSAAKADEGARAAVRAFRVAVAAMEPLLAECLDRPGTGGAYAEEMWRYAAGWILRALAAAREEAAREGGGGAGEYAFTVAAAVAGRARTGFVQVGDGALCAKTRDGACRLVFPPQKGRHANETEFLEADTVERDAHLTAVAATEPLDGVLAMSDGPETNMIDAAAGRPAPVVARMIDDCGGGELDGPSLRKYLTGSRWLADLRGGDDKSIAVFARKRRKW
jgi:hypothetical protein